MAIRSNTFHTASSPLKPNSTKIAINTLKNTCGAAHNLGNTPPIPGTGTGTTLYLGNNMVTTEMDEQIAYAAHAPAQVKYLMDKYEWTDTQVSAINWNAIGLAKKCLTRKTSIRISKMMHNWLNMGQQKKKI